MKKTLIFMFLFTLLLSACGGEFSAEKRVISKSISLMDRLSASMGSGDAEKLAASLDAFEKDFSPLLPDLKAVISAHPDWDENPPKGMKPLMDAFMKSHNALSAKLQDHARALPFSQDSAELRRSLSKCSALIRKL